MSERIAEILDRIERTQNGEGLEIASDALPLDFLCAVFRDQRQPMNRRMKAAEIAAEYVHPTFKAMAVVHAGGDFATRHERAIERSRTIPTEPVVNNSPLLEAQALVEATKELPPPKPNTPSFIPAKLTR